jgi:hypothetical protein
MRGYVRGWFVQPRCGEHAVPTAARAMGEATCITRGRQQSHNESASRVEVCGNRSWSELGWCTRVLYPVVHIARPSQRCTASPAAPVCTWRSAEMFIPLSCSHWMNRSNALGDRRHPATSSSRYHVPNTAPSRVLR